MPPKRRVLTQSHSTLEELPLTQFRAPPSMKKGQMSGSQVDVKWCERELRVGGAIISDQRAYVGMEEARGVVCTLPP